jgi:predicted ATPase
VLAARIDRLTADEKTLVQQLAVMGRQFPLSLIHQMIPGPEEELYRLLASLQRKEFLYEQPAFPETEYIFKHALTQEVAYNSVLHERRKALHEQTAWAIEALYSDNLDERYSDLAHHYSRSGNTQKAVEYLGLAGQQAAQRSANSEAITHLTAALELIKTLPSTLERDQQELALQIALGVPLMTTKGFAAPGMEKIYTRAHELCRQIGETPQLFPVLWGLWEFYLTQTKFQTARELGEQCLTLAQRVQEPGLLVPAYSALGMTLYWLGEFAPSREYVEQGIALYDPQQHGSHTLLYAYDPGVACLFYAAWDLWHLGYPDQALKRSHEALTLAQELSHPFSLAVALVVAAWLHQFRREGQATQEWAESIIALSTEQEFAQWLAVGTVLRGWALVEQGQREEGIPEMRQGMDALQAIGSEIERPCFLALLAEACGKVGQAEEGLAALAEALTMVDKSGERFYEADLYRLRGQLILKSQVPGSRSTVEKDAEECFLKAIEIARRQQAKSLELRASVSLTRLWQSQGKQAEAHHMLSEVYHWFTEGFDTKDLQEAKVLLEELS